MKTFKMYVKTVIYDEQEKILLLNKKREDNKPSWDLPGSAFTEEQNFDETIINNVQKEIGYYVYPGKIIGISDYSNQQEKEVNVIMEGSILNGDLLLSKEYETHTWVPLERIKDYPLAPWLNDYIKNTKNPFTNVEREIEEKSAKKQRRLDFSRENFRSNTNSEDNTEKVNKSVKSSFSLLKDTIIRTFHPQEAKVTQTTPKSNQYHDNDNQPEEESVVEKLNINFKRKEEEYIDKSILKSDENDIIIDHDDIVPENNTEDIIINHEKATEDIIPEHNTEDIIINHEKATEDIVPENNTEDIIPEKEVKKQEPRTKKIFDMNINRQKNMKNNVTKIKKVIRKEKPKQEPEIKIIHSNEETPHIRTEKESTGKISFNSENIKRNGWKERLNRINRTEANNQKKEAPRPKGKRK